MSDCVFCRIVSGELGSEKVYEDDETLAFLDIRPFTAGHTLVVPKKHVADLANAEPELVAAALGAKLGRIGRAAAAATGATGFNVLIANGVSAGQEIFHLHAHVIPRSEDDGFRLAPSEGHDPATLGPELPGIAAKIRAALG